MGLEVGGISRKVFSDYWWYDLAQHGWNDFAKRYRHLQQKIEWRKLRVLTLPQPPFLSQEEMMNQVERCSTIRERYY